MHPLQECIARQRPQATGDWEDLMVMELSVHHKFQWWTVKNVLLEQVVSRPQARVMIKIDASPTG